MRKTLGHILAQRPEVCSENIEKLTIILLLNISNIINISNGNERSEWGAEGAPHNTTHIAQFLKIPDQHQIHS